MSDYIEALGIIAPKAVYRNLTPAQLVEHALRRGEGTLSETGALVVTTGKYTGRSPDDRFVVDAPDIHDDIDWGKINVPISEEKYEAIYNRMTAYLQGRELFVFEGFAGADESYHLPVRVVNELASQNLFIHQLLVRPTEEQLKDFVPGFTIIAAPGFKCSPEVDGVHSEAAIIVNFKKHTVIIAGSQYAGEIKKSVFSALTPKQAKMFNLSQSVPTVRLSTIRNSATVCIIPTKTALRHLWRKSTRRRLRRLFPQHIIMYMPENIYHPKFFTKYTSVYHNNWKDSTGYKFWCGDYKWRAIITIKETTVSMHTSYYEKKLEETNSPRMREFYEHGLMDIKNRTFLSFKIEK